MSISEELEKLGKLRADGLMSEAEFEQAKQRLLGSGDAASSSTTGGGNLSVEKSDFDVNQWAMFMHLSQLSNFLIPFAGVVAPIVMWQMKKDQSAVIDKHGKIIVNWMISAFIYAAVSVVLLIVLIGAITGIALAAVSVIFAIVGGVKANNGECWDYPLTIKFLK